MLESCLAFCGAVRGITGVSTPCVGFWGVTGNCPGIGLLGSSCASLGISLASADRPLGVGSNLGPSGL